MLMKQIFTFLLYLTSILTGRDVILKTDTCLLIKRRRAEVDFDCYFSVEMLILSLLFKLGYFSFVTKKIKGLG